MGGVGRRMHATEKQRCVFYVRRFTRRLGGSRTRRPQASTHHAGEREPYGKPRLAGRLVMICELIIIIIIIICELTLACVCDSTQRGGRTSNRAYAANHDPDWVKSANSGSNPMRNQSPSRRSVTFPVSVVVQTPFWAHPNALCSSFKPVKRKGDIRSNKGR